MEARFGIRAGTLHQSKLIVHISFDLLHFFNLSFSSFHSGHILTSLTKDTKIEENKSSFLTDLPFVDILITPSALMLPLVPIEPKPFPVEHNENETNVISLSGMQLYSDEMSIQVY
jgi:hypothetical protein